MGNTLSCCYCPSRGQRSGSREPYYESEVYEVMTGDTMETVSSPAALEPAEQDLEACEGNHAQQKISCPEMPEVQENMKKKKERPKPLTKKSNSCPMIIVSDSTITKPALKSTMKGDRVRKLRSNSYLRAIQADCSQEDRISLQSLSPLPSTSSLSSSGLVTYEKTPPPVPPRATSEPFISILVQSSTGSAQDPYLDSQDHKSEETSQLGLSNSLDSLNSSTQPPRQAQGAVIPASEAPEPSPKHAALQSDPGTLTSFESHSEAIPSKKPSLVEMEVDCIEPVPREEPSPPTNFQSIGDQVEDDWRSSVPSHSMSSQQDTNSDTPDAIDLCCKSSERSLQECTSHPNAISIDDSPQQAPAIAQIKCNLSSRENSDLEASSISASDPGLQTASRCPAEAAQQGACCQDGSWFLKLLQEETERLEGWCCQMDKEAKENHLSEEVLGEVLSAVGSAQLLMSQKFQQFQGLCEQNLNPDANPRPTAQDLAGFWDLLQLSIEDISIKFAELHRLKANSWQLVETPEKTKEEKKPPALVPKKPAKCKAAVSHDKASDARDKQRQEARKRLLAARRAASLRPNSAAQSPDSLQVYFYEA